MCDDGGTIQANMIWIIISLALLKLRIWSIFCETIMLWDVIFYFDDGLMIDIFGDYFYIMKYYIYSSVWMCDCFVITLYSYSLEVFHWGLSH